MGCTRNRCRGRRDRGQIQAVYQQTSNKGCKEQKVVHAAAPTMSVRTRIPLSDSTLLGLMLSLLCLPCALQLPQPFPSLLSQEKRALSPLPCRFSRIPAPATHAVGQ